MIISAIVIASILREIESLQTRSTSYVPGTFSSLNEIDYSLDNLSFALSQYHQAKTVGDSSSEIWKIKYIDQFNIVWGNLQVFRPVFRDNPDAESQVEQFRLDASSFLNDYESLFNELHSLSNIEISALISETKSLRDAVHDLNQQYFRQSLNYKDNWLEQTKSLNNLLWVVSGVLFVAASALVGLLFISNMRKQALVHEAQQAREELSIKMDELRSGRAEQKAKDSFLAAASHDLRQPLHALGLFLGSLGPHVKNDKGHQTLQEAIQCSNNLQTLFNSMLDLSRLDAGVIKADKSDFDISQLVHSIVTEFLAKANKASIDFHVDVDSVIVNTDPTLLGRIIRNLIDNAIKHSNANNINISVRNPGQGKVFLHISDDGRGIPTAEQKQIFDEYYQIEKQIPDDSKGLGLGLSIVKRMADLLAMNVELKSAPGVRTEFILNLQAGDAAAVQHIDNTFDIEVTNPLLSDTCIAVIDDDEKILLAMTTMLANMDLQAITARSADELIDKIIETDTYPKLIVADYRLLKGKTGDQAIVQVRRALNLGIPGILVTGDISPVRVAEAAKSEFELLHKPVQPNQLMSCIYRLLLEDQKATYLVQTERAVDRTA
jgi:signal transduction histidine kinase/CheY-like chemotaxis protein